MADLFKDFLGDTIDLDDWSIYDAKLTEMESFGIWEIAASKAGGSLFYMKHLWPDVCGGNEQYVRVSKMCNELARMFPDIKQDSKDNRLKVLKWLYKFEDETENQC